MTSHTNGRAIIRRPRLKRLCAVSTLSLVLSTTLLGLGPSNPAHAVDVCTPYQGTLVSGTTDVCEWTFTSSPGGAWTPPTDTAALEALLVGSGGAGDGNGFGGGGGEVKVAKLEPSGDVTIQVGQYAGARDTTVTQLSATTTASAGKNTDHSVLVGGASGNGNAGSEVGGGGGAGGPATSHDGGPGLTATAAANDPSSLFNGDATCYGGGGAGTGWYDNLDRGSEANCGGGVPNPTSLADLAPTANSGGGAGADLIAFSSADGADGVVVLRARIAAATSPTSRLILGSETCSSVFLNSTATPLSGLRYTTSKRGRTTWISGLTPGTFAYWAKVTLTANGTLVTQSAAPSHQLLGQASGTFLYDAHCNAIKSAKITTKSGVTRVTGLKTFGTYYLGLKLSASGLTGSKPPTSQVTYTFTSNAGADPASTTLTARK